MNIQELQKHYRQVRARLATLPKKEPVVALEPEQDRIEINREQERARHNELLAGLPPCTSDLRFSILQILIAYNTPWAIISGNRRAREIIASRRAVTWLLHTRNWSTQRIGAFMNRDHTTVVHSLGVINFYKKKRPGRPPWL